MSLPQLAPRIRELELMHQYSTETCLTFSATAVSAEVWKVFAVQEALKHDFLMDGLLGLAALHIAVKRASQTDEYVDCALEHQNRAFSGFRVALSSLTQENCNALFAFSVVAMMGVILSTRFTEDESDNGHTGSILLLFELLEGIRFVCKGGREWLQHGPFGPVFGLLAVPMPTPQNPNVKLALDELEALNENFSGMKPEEQHMTLAAAIRDLRICFSKEKELVLVWLAMAGKTFMNEFRRGEPMAMLIFLHWGVLLNRLSDEWWVQDSGKRLVEELAEKLQVGGEKWVTATLWARYQVGLSGQIAC